MSSELSRLYQSLASDVSEETTTPPEAIRRWADRRARTRAAVTAGLAAVLVAVTAVGSQIVLTGAGHAPVVPGAPVTSGPPPTPATSATPGPGGSASASATPSAPVRPPTAIPDRAFFDMPQQHEKDVISEIGSDNMMPDLCGATYRADRELLARRTRHFLYKYAESGPGYVPDGSMDHTVTSYPDDGATEYLEQVREAVRDCPADDASDIEYRYRLLDGPPHGDESLLIERSVPGRNPSGDASGGSEVHLISVVRVGPVVTVLYEQGWEGSSSDPALHDTFTALAVDAVRQWLAQP